MGCKPMENAKPKHRKGLWSPEEDNKLRKCILKHGHGCWSSVPIKAGLQRNGKSCRLRWINYLRPGLKRGMFSKQEEDTILNLHHMLGNKWSQIAQHLPGRTDNEIKNYWHSYLKKKLAKAKEIESHDQQQIQNVSSSSETMEYYSLSPQKIAIQESSYGIFENMEKSLAHYYDHSYEHNNYNYNKEACQGSLPKVLFAEWLSVDHVNGFDQNSTFQEGVTHISEGPFCGEQYDHNSLSHGSSNEAYNSQINFSNQVVGNEFMHCMPGGADLLCDNNFSLNNDAMYV